MPKVKHYSAAWLSGSATGVFVGTAASGYGELPATATGASATG